MNPEDQNIAICQWLGRTYHKPTEVELKSGSYYQYEPNFTNDLNAMREAEKQLVNKDLWWKYCTALNGKVCEDADEPLNQDPETLWEMIHASAAQRTEALLRTIGKWKST